MTQTPNPSNGADLLEKLVAMADQRVQAQLDAAIAADQRALVFAGLVAIAAAAFGGAAASALTDNPPELFMGRLALLAAAGMLGAMFCAIVAARPVKWFFAGSQPANWSQDLATEKPFTESLGELLLDYDDRISKNERTMMVNSRWLLASGIIAMATLLIAGAALITKVW